MPYSSRCPRCEATIVFDVPEEEACECGWSEDDGREPYEALREMCELMSWDYDAWLDYVESLDDD